MAAPPGDRGDAGLGPAFCWELERDAEPEEESAARLAAAARRTAPIEAAYGPHARARARAPSAAAAGIGEGRGASIRQRPAHTRHRADRIENARPLCRPARPHGLGSHRAAADQGARDSTGVA